MPEIKRKEFDNGLVLLTEKFYHPEEKAVLLVGIKVGGGHEDKEISGASHFNEHMLFKSNKYESMQQLREGLEYFGTDINAFTSETKTVFYAKALPDYLPNVIPIVYRAATNFCYDQKEVENERGAILSEIRMSAENPARYAYFNLFVPTLFKGHHLEEE